MPSTTPSLSVVIVNYNTRDLLRACLVSLQQQPQPCEVIVVDNASKDGSADMVRAEFPQVRLLAETHNTWFCGGNNRGIALSHNDYVLLLNPDTVVIGDALAQMVTFLHNHADYAGVTAQLRYPNGQIQRTCSRIPTYPYLLINHTLLGLLWGRLKARLNDHHWYAEWQRDTDFDVQVVPGSCTLMRRTDSHLMDELRLYFPEDALAHTVQRPFRYLATAVIEHHEKSATQSWLATQVYFDDLFIYTRRFHGWWRMALLWGLSRPLYWGMWLRRKLG